MDEPLHYAGFWKRLAATLIDMVLITAVIALLLWVVYGEAYLNRAQPVPGSVVYVRPQSHYTTHCTQKMGE